MSQEVLSGLVGHTADWLSKVERNRINLDRLSVVRSLAEALGITVGDLLGEPTLLEWNNDASHQSVLRLREALLDYRQLSPFFTRDLSTPIVSINALRNALAEVWTAYQGSRYGYMSQQLPPLLQQTQKATQTLEGFAKEQAYQILALSYQAATVLLTKVGEAELAWISAERGLQSARQGGSEAIEVSLCRSVVHALLSTGRYSEARELTEVTIGHLQSALGEANAEYLSMYGSLLLAGSMAAARDNNRSSVQTFLSEAEESASRVGQDANHLWSAFGPTNVLIHKTATAFELGDVQVAIDLGSGLDTGNLPLERQVRHAIEVARAYTAWNRADEALTMLLEAEKKAPEQVRHHTLSRLLVQTWIQRARTKPSHTLTQLAQRLHILES